MHSKIPINLKEMSCEMLNIVFSEEASEVESAMAANTLVDVFLYDGVGSLIESPGAQLILKERDRQVEEEGFLDDRDDSYVMEELAMAAVTYALPSHHTLRHPNGVPFTWPNGWSWKESTCDRIGDLAKAGALIAAEIDRLIRAQEAGEDGC